MMLVEVPNGSLKQYYYDVIKRLYDVKLSDMTTTEDFYYNIQDCYERGLDIGECVNNLIKIKEKTNGWICKRVVVTRTSSYPVSVGWLFPN